MVGLDSRIRGGRFRVKGLGFGVYSLELGFWVGT